MDCGRGRLGGVRFRRASDRKCTTALLPLGPIHRPQVQHAGSGDCLFERASLWEHRPTVTLPVVNDAAQTRSADAISGRSRAG